MEVFKNNPNITPICSNGRNMNSVRLEYLVAYDIESNKNRSLIFKILEGYGLRAIQKSVFWGYLTNAEFQTIVRLVQYELDQNDKFLITRSKVKLSHLGTYWFGYMESDFEDWPEYGVI